MAITTAFQAVDTGSIPVTCSIREIAIFAPWQTTVFAVGKPPFAP